MSTAQAEPFMVQVPVAAAMAVHMRNEAQNEESERAEIKRLTLQANKTLDVNEVTNPLAATWATHLRCRSFT